jgi:uncharacterized protein YjfI (DUF2170 family)
MKCRIVFDDWRQKGKGESIYNTELGIELSLGDLHSGTTFETEIDLPEDLEKEIEIAMREYGAYPVFRVLTD